MDLIYLNRISTDNKDQDPTSNLETSKRWCSYNNHKIAFSLIDKGISGSVPYYDRPEAKKIKDIINEYHKKNKEIGIVVFSIDRFSREHPIYAMVNILKLKELGVPIFSVSESIFNEDSEFALPMQFNILWFNYYFLIQHSKKVKAGMEKRRLEGKVRTLVKEVIGKGKDKTFIYYSKEELDEIHKLIKEYSKKYSYRTIENRMLRLHKVNVSIGYISKVINNKL